MTNHINDKRYNILRHVGTSYSILEIYVLMLDNELLAEGKRTFKYLFKQIKPLKVNGNEVVIEKGAQKLSNNALEKYTQVNGDNKHIPLMQSLTSWIKDSQRR